MVVLIIDYPDVRNPTRREAFWAEKLKCYAPQGLSTLVQRSYVNFCTEERYIRTLHCPRHFVSEEGPVPRNVRMFST